MVSSFDVARRAGVSRSAVSRVFTPGASASPPTRAKVLAAAKALNYRPNVLARSLITGRSRIIGLVAAYLDNQYYPVVLEKLCRALQEQGYHVLIFMAAESSADAESVVSDILDYQADGIILASVEMSSTLAARCADKGVPVVLFNRTQDDPRFSAVTSDNFAGGRLLARFLAAGGHERIAYLAGWPGASTQRDREAGFREGLVAEGCHLFARDCGNYDFSGAQEATRRLLGGKRRPDALFVANDHMAIAAMDVIRFEIGLRIPQDVSVVSYDDVPQAAWPTYSLTTIRQPTEQMIPAVVDLLIRPIEQEDATPYRRMFPGSLVVRQWARIPERWNNEGV